MSEPSIILSQNLASHRPEYQEDVVFVRRDDTGTELYSFNLGELAKEVNIQWEEVNVPVGAGSAGQGIHKISGDIILFQNDAHTMNNLQQHLGRTYELHQLFFNGDTISSAYVSRGQRLKLAGSPYAYIANRFNNIESQRSQFGVVLTLAEGTQGARELRIIVSGATAEKITFQSTSAEFYSRFTKLNT